MFCIRHAKMAFVSNRLALYTQSARQRLNSGYYTPEQTNLITGSK